MEIAPIAQPINCKMAQWRGAVIKKLLNLKQWLTVADAARPRRASRANVIFSGTPE
jgi:hypothetical protein